ncbi:speract receptor-like isoform X1 [Diadema antillarum]|uniref:speract receptor-like n=2 Tax=Diadema antillarum TaxID=105358 RepID=UPI003A884D5F
MRSNRNLVVPPFLLCACLALAASNAQNTSTTTEGHSRLDMMTTLPTSSLDLAFVSGNQPVATTMVPGPGQLKELKLGYLASASRDSIQRFAQRIGGAMIEAVKDVNSNPDLLPGYNVTFEWTDTGIGDLQAISALTKQWSEGVVAFFGPNPTCTHEARIASAWQLPMISDTCAESAVSDKATFPTFARTVPTDDLLTEAVVVVLKYFRWYNVSIVSASIPSRISVKNNLEQKLPDRGIHIGEIRVFKSPFVSSLFREDNTETDLSRIVKETYEHTRIYIFIGELFEIYEFLREMMIHGLLENGEYMVIWANSENYDEETLQLLLGEPYWREPSPEVIMYYRSMLALYLSPATDPSYEAFKVAVFDNLRQPPFEFNYGNFTAPHKTPIEAAYLYDAVYNVYAPALNEALADGIDVRNGTEIMKRILCRKRNSITGRPKYIDKNGDAYSDITVISMRLEKDINKYGYTMLPVATIKITNSTPAVEKSCLGNGTSFKWVYEPINGTFIPWISGAPPLAVPNCGFYGEFCIKEHRPVAQIASGVVGGIVFIICMVLIAVYRNWKYEQELASLLWKIDYSDIQTKRHNGSTMSAISKLSLMTTDSRNSLDPGRCQIFTEVGTYKNILVAIKKVYKRHLDLSRSVRKELKVMRDLRHPHLNQFIGACVDPPNICIITEYCPKGSLQDILENEEVKLDSMFIASLIGDTLKGLGYLHASEIHSHGNLKSSNCVVDSRWVLKITDFGLHQFRSGSNPPEMGDHAKYEKLLWKAPELLQDDDDKCPEGTQKGDIYALGIILYEMATRQGPFGKCVLGPKEIIEKIKNPLTPSNPFRPQVMDIEDCPACMLTTMQECWREMPEERPDIKAVTSKLKPLQKGMKPNILDNMILIMEKYANNLEEIVEDRTQQLIEEKKKTDNLLHQMLPKPVANQLKRGMQVVPESFDCVTIFFSDIVGFTSLSSESSPFEVVDMLNDLYTLFDEIISYYDVYKVETIGDAYMLVSGLPLRNENKHAAEIASTALHLLDAVKQFRVRHRPDVNLKLRIGIHSGSTVAGVVGLTMPRYCLFGDTVNTASRMESNGEALKIHTSSECKKLLDEIGGFELEERGLISMKGKGQLLTYWLTSADTSYRRNSPFRTAEENETVGLFDSKHPKNGTNLSNRYSKTGTHAKEQFTKRLESDVRPANMNTFPSRDVNKKYANPVESERPRPNSMFAIGNTPNHFPSSTLIDFGQMNNSNENSPKVTDRLLGNVDGQSICDQKSALSCTNSLVEKRRRLNDSALEYANRNNDNDVNDKPSAEVETMV